MPKPLRDNDKDHWDASDNVNLSEANDKMRGTSIIRGTHVPTAPFRGSVCIPLLSRDPLMSSAELNGPQCGSQIA